ncbi:MAG: zinc-ribbon domain containing protein [Candidatus Harrisonbacteria bacterium]|nr:zinc-ribbon domain containing protein [Candidatus Harrisonbacteria bacterium]
MTSKTPKFDAAIGKILDTLAPHERACKQCGASFQVLAGDIEFYKMFRVPPPTLCPECREQRRLAQRISLRPIFYKRPCVAPGHTESIVTFYHPQSRVVVYDDKFYVSDAWDAATLGEEYDPAKGFFEQYAAFALRVPHSSLWRDLTSVGCEYTLSGKDSKDCYYSLPLRSERVYYSMVAVDSKDCVDVSYVTDSELCYECYGGEKLYNCNFCYYSVGCTDSGFLFDCRNCTQCFGCTNLRNKKYCFENEQLTKEEYEKRLREMGLGKRSVVRAYSQKFFGAMRTAIHKGTDILQSINSIGDGLRNCKDCHDVFYSIGGGERMRYVYSVDIVTDTGDVFGASKSSRIYESTGIINSSDILCCRMIRGGMGLEYSAECTDCNYCFACFGLRSKKFHIFNKPYSEEEYWRRIDDIKTRMLAAGEYGEFFPIAASEIPYNDSNAMLDYPLTKDEVQARGWKWYDAPTSDIDLAKANAIAAADVPDDIADVSDDILARPVVCEKTGKPFRITAFELAFYRKKRIPLPTIHPLERVEARYAIRRPWRLHDDTCRKCGKPIKSVFPPEEKYNVYCESCYNNEVI